MKQQYFPAAAAGSEAHTVAELQHSLHAAAAAVALLPYRHYFNVAPLQQAPFSSLTGSVRAAVSTTLSDT